MLLHQISIPVRVCSLLSFIVCIRFSLVIVSPKKKKNLFSHSSIKAMDDCYEFWLIKNDRGGYSDNEWETSFSNGAPLKTMTSSQKSFSATLGVKLIVKPDVRDRDFEGWSLKRVCLLPLWILTNVELSLIFITKNKKNYKLQNYITE